MAEQQSGVSRTGKQGRRRLFPVLACASLLMVTSTVAGAQPTHARPRLGLVLSGGAARGSAHIGVLRVLEELRVAPDYVTGTSMGAIIGGLYAAGYSAAEIEEAFQAIDWEGLFSDQPARERLPFRRKEDDREAFFGFEFGLGSKGLKLPSGIVAGQQLSFLLRTYLLHTVELESFDELPTPFRTVATDLSTGEMVVYDRGDLAGAIRASMSIPGVFMPAKLGGRTLADGGIVRNLPVDVALGMGAERILAVDISSPVKEIDGGASLFDLVSQTLTILTNQNLVGQAALLRDDDVLLVPELSVTGSDFEAYPTAIGEGAAAARARLPELRSFGASEEDYAAYLRARRVRRQRSIPVIDRIEVEGLVRVDPRRVTRLIETPIGQALDTAILKEDLERVFRMGEFELVDFTLEEQSDSDAETGHTLVIDAREKSWGPGFLRLGLGLEANFSGRSEFLLQADYRRAHINRRGAEWQTRFSVGEALAVYTELYQPVDFAGFLFVAPQLFAGRDVLRGVGDAGEEIENERRSYVGALDVGVRLGNDGEVRLGLVVGRTEVKTVTSPGDPETKSDVGAWTGRIEIDRLDNAFFPRRGTFARASALLSRAVLGAGDSYDRAEVRAIHSRSFGSHTLLLVGQAGSGVESSIPFYSQFRLGGFGRLSGFRRDSLHGQVVLFGALGYFLRVPGLKGPLSEKLYVGGNVEAGNVWNGHAAVRFDGFIPAGLVYVGMDTPLGPVYVGEGFAEGGVTASYLFLGRLF